MRKITFFLMALIIAIMASAEPADPTPITVTQPDGSSLQLKLVGDEFYHFNTTIDGYTIINVNGNWEYATKDGEKLIPSGIIAHDPSSRNTQELQLVASLKKHIVDLTETSQASKIRATRDKKNRQQKSPVIDYSQFRGLIILINYNDKQFQMSDPNNFYDQMCNTENYTGFYHQGQFQSCTGSVRDYFYDNSMGMFDPEFDVVGPISVDYSCLDGNDQHRDIFQAAMDAVDAQVDFSQYDADNNGEIDMVFFMVAGYASSYSGNNSGYLWPHMSYLYGYNGSYYYYLNYDGKRMGRYASSCEIYGWESYGYTVPNAIGTVCHEFSHVMGLPDLYDTDYEGSGGQSNHPGNWDVMAGGNHSNYGRTPTGYSLWERWEMGFTSKPEELTVGTKSLTALNISNSGYMMSSPNDGEYFLFENRQANKWDASLPGHGLVITRVERTNEQVWANNDVNVDPNHNYYELVRASGTGESNVPFPGSSNVTSINSSSSPALLTWAGDPCQYGLSNIAENNKIITFNVVTDMIPTSIIEDFEQMAVTTAPPADDVQGVLSKWKFVNCYVTNPGSSYCSGEHSATFKKPSSLTMTEDVRYVSNKISFDAYNSSTSAAKFILYYSTDLGETWTAVANTSGETTTTLAANSNATINFNFDMNVPARYRISLSAGATTYKAYIDNFTIYYTDVLSINTIEDFEQMAVTTAPPADDVQGVLSKWKFVNCYVTNPGSSYCSGEHAAVFKKPSSLTMTEDVRYVSNKISFDAYNASTSAAKFILYYSTDKGDTWTAVANTSGETTTTVAANSNATINFPFDMDVPARYRISLSAGATTYKAYIDNFTIYYTNTIYPTNILAEYISLNKSNLSLNLGENETLIATILPDDATVKTVEWSSSNSDVASVDANGTVTALSPGAATIIATTTDGTNLSASCNVTVTVMTGDANCDGTIDVADYVATTSYILELNPQPFMFEAADINSNDEINVCDLVGVAYLALTYEGAPLVMPTLNLNSVANLSIDAQVMNYSADTYDIAINLSNDIDLSALQMDVTLPRGMTLVNAALSDRASASHQATFSQLTNGDYRLVAASPTCKAFNGNDGTVLTLTLNGDAFGTLLLHGIKLSSPMTQGYNFDDINLALSITGFDRIVSEVKIYGDGKNIIIDSPHKGTAQIVMPDGRSKTVTVTTGRNIYPAPASGIIIVKMSDEVKKLLIH